MKNKKLVLAFSIIGSLLLSIGIAYAAFVSNALSISNNSITSGEAAIKFCDTVAANQWTTSMNPFTSLNRMIPGEERDVYAGRNIYVGNDGGSLQGVLGSGQCNGYLTAANQSNTPLKIIPTLQFSNDDCPAAAAAETLVRINLADQSSGFQPVSYWATNNTPVNLTLTANNTAHLQVSAKLDPSAVTQTAHCNFSLNLTGQQAM